MRKPRHDLTVPERNALAADLALRDTLATKRLMRKYDVGRTTIARITAEIRSKGQNDLIQVQVLNPHTNTLAE